MKRDLTHTRALWAAGQVKDAGQDRMTHLLLLLHESLILVKMEVQSLAGLIYLHSSVLGS